MTKKEKSILIALVLGDGTLFHYKHHRYNSYHSGIRITHSSKQKGYLEYKKQILENIFKCKITLREFDNSGYQGVSISKGHKYFGVLKRYIYKNKRKIFSRKVLNRLDAQGIAIWWMDDGCLFPKKRNNKIHAWELYLNTYLSEQENLIIIKYFQEKWNVTWKINRDRGKTRLRMSTKEGRKFLKIVRPYVKEIDCMSYKAQNI